MISIMAVKNLAKLFLILIVAQAIAPKQATAENKLSQWIDKIYVAQEPAPTIIVGHGCGGFGNHEHEWAKQIQSWGFNAVVLDSFNPRGLFGGTCNSARLLPGARVSDVYEIAEVVKQQRFHKGKVGYVGFSHGGALALHLANDAANQSVSAAVAYYPNCSRGAKSIKSVFGEKRSFDDPKIPAVMMLAEKDDWTPIKLCLESVKDGNYQVHRYKNATHAFDMNLPMRQAHGWTLWYDKEADEDSRQKTREFFESTLKDSKHTGKQ